MNDQCQALGKMGFYFFCNVFYKISNWLDIKHLWSNMVLGWKSIPESCTLLTQWWALNMQIPAEEYKSMNMHQSTYNHALVMQDGLIVNKSGSIVCYIQLSSFKCKQDKNRLGWRFISWIYTRSVFPDICWIKAS